MCKSILTTSQTSFFVQSCFNKGGGIWNELHIQKTVVFRQLVFYLRWS